MLKRQLMMLNCYIYQMKRLKKLIRKLIMLKARSMMLRRITGLLNTRSNKIKQKRWKAMKTRNFF